MPAFIDIAGKPFGRWKVLHRIKGQMWMCECRCGTVKAVSRGNLISGGSQSCGCYHREVMKTRSRHVNQYPEYHIWLHMIGRCENPNNAGYVWYGARGITMDHTWRASFWTFFEEMGPRPSPAHSIERINNDGPYAAWNCKWATIKEQNRNKRWNRQITFQGKTQCAVDWDEQLGFRLGLVRHRIDQGWTVEDALTIPLNGRKRGAPGERNGRALLTPDDVRRIRALKGTMPAREVATIFPVKPVTVSAIWAGRLWKHIT